jgi:hypothetical protein
MSYPAIKADWKALTIKLDPRIDELISAEAERECRTKTDQVRFICRWYFEERERDNDRMGD